MLLCPLPLHSQFITFNPTRCLHFITRRSAPHVLSIATTILLKSFVSITSAASAPRPQSHSPNHIYYRFCHVIGSPYTASSAHDTAHIDCRVGRHCQWPASLVGPSGNSHPGRPGICVSNTIRNNSFCVNTNRHILDAVTVFFLHVSPAKCRQRLYCHSNLCHSVLSPPLPPARRSNASRCLLAVHELCITAAAATAAAMPLYMSIYQPSFSIGSALAGRCLFSENACVCVCVFFFHFSRLMSRSAWGHSIARFIVSF